MTFFTKKRFLPLFLIQFFGAFNDNLFKNALVMLITYRLASDLGGNAQILVTAAAGIFILPFFLFSATAGQLADKYERSMIARMVKIFEIILMVLASIGFYSQNIYILMTVLFGMGIHSTFFGPIKYALLPQHLQDDELLSGNAYIEAGTFLSILFGTILGGLLVLHPMGETLISIGIVGCAVIGYFCSRFIPPAPAHEPDLKIGKNIFTETAKLISYSREDRTIYRCIIGISWFWFIGATFLSQFPSYAKDTLQADGTVVTLFLTVFSVGIGVGSVLCNKILRGQIQATFVPIAAIGISIFAFDLAAASHHAVFTSDGSLMTAGFFVHQLPNWRILIDLFLTAVCGGLYIVPLYALMQHKGDPRHMARLIATNNVINSLFMVASAILLLGLAAIHFTLPQIFVTVAIMNLIVAYYICHLLPDALPRSIARFILSLLYRVEVHGTENFAKAGKRVLIVANHTSFLDGALIASYLPEKISFAVNTHIAGQKWLKPFLSLVDAFPVDPTNPLAAKTMIEKLKADTKCMIFPEGRITITGALMKIYEGPGMIADKSGAAILPIRIDGAQYSPFSRLKGRVHIRLFPKITLTILPPHHLHLPEDVTGRRRRQMASAQLYDIMCDMMFHSSHINHTLFNGLIEARRIHGHKHIIVEDIERKPLTYSAFLMRSFILGQVIHRVKKNEKILGLMLPNAVGTIVTFFALQSAGHIPAMINFTAGSAAILSSCKLSGVKTILTSRLFIEKARLDKVIAEVQEGGIDILYLDDLRAQISVGDKLFGLFAKTFPSFTYHWTTKTTPQSPAVILFTSGSEGTPKGVVLSHINIMSNRHQLASRIDFGPSDKVFNCLPMFHAFGLTGGTLLPLLSGIRTFYYPSPLHYRIVPELIYDINATILFGTDTFLAGYVRMAHPYDLHSIRYVFAGAEKLKDETRRAFIDKFGVRIFEGYGATETAPGISINTPMQNRAGTVGRLMPAMEYQIKPVEGIETGGQLWVKGPNIMLGYFRIEKPEQLQPPENGWYDTGDIVAMDQDGYISIQGRTKRFAKIAGEMVSLATIETAVSALSKDQMHAAIALPDERKGEQIILLTTDKTLSRDILNRYFKDHHLPDLAVPKKIFIVDKIPLLGTGKTDYQKSKTLAADLLSANP
jgi:acyl-[acyl-carrier-protein]-phospholipid O-acyltransferase/long-chain-fatty-acid--[acyl-carrier-protein] ligase